MKRYVVIVGLVLGLCAAGLLTGAGSAHAGAPCNDQSWPVPDFNITTGTGPFSTYAGSDVYTNGPFGNNGFWVCASPTHGEPAQSYVVVTAQAGDPTSGPAGGSIQAGHCSPAPVGSPGGWACNYLLAPTGPSIAPAVSPNAPLDSTAGSGGSVGTGGGTCVQVDGSPPTCHFGGLTLAGVTVNEGDASVGTHTTSNCVTVGGGCPTTVPTGVGVDAFEGDPGNDTLTVTVAGNSDSRDLGDCYVGVNAPSSC
ncbi:MAG TPA: hypothetical protein VHF47_06660 [Acidimicrobiales bacterium]|nr:hypothetical protein [Acidimicrobiales bacterium]